METTLLGQVESGRVIIAGFVRFFSERQIVEEWFNSDSMAHQRFQSMAEKHICLCENIELTILFLTLWLSFFPWKCLLVFSPKSMEKWCFIFHHVLSGTKSLSRNISTLEKSSGKHAFTNLHLRFGMR